MTKRVLVTEPIVDSVLDYLRERYDVEVGARGDFDTEEALAEAVPGFHALLPMLSNPVTSRVLEAGGELQVVANHAVGYNNVDLAAARRLDIRIANTPDVLTEASADCAMALMLGVTRRICEAQEYLRAGRFEGWEPLGFLGMELGGRTLGIYGMGRIGTALARRARAFGMEIRYHNRSEVDPQTANELQAGYADSLDDLARSADVLSLNCPLTDETRHAVDRRILEQMPSHAVLINTSRGPVVDEAALAEALHEGTIAGAGLDVYEREPDVHPRLLEAPGCVLTPHIASATRRARRDIGMLAARAISGVLEGRPGEEIPNLVA